MPDRVKLDILVIADYDGMFSPYIFCVQYLMLGLGMPILHTPTFGGKKVHHLVNVV